MIFTQSIISPAMNKTTAFFSLSPPFLSPPSLSPSLFLSPPLSDHSLCILMMAEYGFQGAISDGGGRSGSGWIPCALLSSHAHLHLSFTLLDMWNLAGQTNLAGWTGSSWLLAPPASCTWSRAGTRCGLCGRMKGGGLGPQSPPAPARLPGASPPLLGNVSSQD